MSDFISLSDIIALFFFGYWIVYNNPPFSIWTLVWLYLGTLILKSVLLAIFNKTEKAYEKSAKDVKDSLGEQGKRLRKLENAVFGGDLEQ